MGPRSDLELAFSQRAGPLSAIFIRETHGLQELRGFVSTHDIPQGCLLALPDVACRLSLACVVANFHGVAACACAAWLHG